MRSAATDIRAHLLPFGDAAGSEPALFALHGVNLTLEPDVRQRPGNTSLTLASVWSKTTCGRPTPGRVCIPGDLVSSTRTSS